MTKLKVLQVLDNVVEKLTAECTDGVKKIIRELVGNIIWRD